MKLFEENKGGLVTPQYEFIPLLNGDILTRTQAKISREGFLKELVSFQQECVANEQALACDQLIFYSYSSCTL
ncbi:unnamed protein product [Adineta steineri]|uniref:Uncharacterized protein n=1 Tax=Adineta steineri TaxID=433720 RepID=A0A814M7E4_9BILA|nr:unnamed protein product [Adineta steineri]